MKKVFFLFLSLLAPFLTAQTTFTGTDSLRTPALWPPDAYEALRIILNFQFDDLDARALYYDLTLPDGQLANTYQVAIDENGGCVIDLDGSMLRSHGQSGAFRLQNLRALTPEGFAALPGSYTTGSYSVGDFRPSCQSTLLTTANGLEVVLEEEEAVISFHCPETTGSLPNFLYGEDYMIDGFAVGVDSCPGTITFPEDASGFFSTETYIALDCTEQGIRYLQEHGNQDGDFSPGETLVLTVPIQWDTLDEGNDFPEDDFTLIFFYHDTTVQDLDVNAVAIHPFDKNRNLQLAKSELDSGHSLWVQGMTTPQFLLEAIELCDAVTYEYDYTTEHFLPVWF